MSLLFATACNSLSDNVSPSSKLGFHVSTKYNHHLVCNSVLPFQTVPVSVSFALVHGFQHVNILKSILCHLHVSSLGKPMFINLSTGRSNNVCNAVKSVSSAHHIHKVFPVTHVISNHRQAF